VDGKRYQNGNTRTMIFQIPANHQLPEPIHEPATR
jgi:hypothetical protein